MDMVLGHSTTRLVIDRNSKGKPWQTPISPYQDANDGQDVRNLAEHGRPFHVGEFPLCFPRYSGDMMGMLGVDVGQGQNNLENGWEIASDKDGFGCSENGS